VFYLDLIENTDETFCFDNIALFNILNKTFRLSSGSFNDINHILAQVMIGITACFRFPGNLNNHLLRND
jgi:tubulin beta